MKRLDYLVSLCTAFNNFEELRVCQTERGYVPTIYPRNARHGELIRRLREKGIRVWTGGK